MTALGDLGGRDPVLRSGARAGSLVAVAGDLGRSAAGFVLLRNGIGDFGELRVRHLVPRPPYGQGRAAAEAGAEAMIDVSDGLLADLGHIAAASGVVVDLRGAALREDVDEVTRGPRGRCGPVVFGPRRRRGPRPGGMFPGLSAARLAGHRGRAVRSAGGAGRR